MIHCYLRHPTVMYTTTEREEWTNSYPVNVPIEYVGTPPSWSPPFFIRGNLSFTMPAFRCLYERLYSDPVWVSGKWKDCQHYRRWIGPRPSNLGIPWVCAPFPLIGKYNSRSWGVPLLLHYTQQAVSSFGSFGDHHPVTPSLIQSDIGDGFVPRPTNLASLKDSSLRAMLPSIKAELSLINSVYELKDFRSLPRTLTKLTSFVQQIGTAVKRSVKLSQSMSRKRRLFSRSLPTFSEALGVSADSYLQTQFNILPLLSDISDLFVAITKTHRRINDLVSRQGKRQHKYFTVQVPTFQAATTSSTINVFQTTGQFSGTYSPQGNYTSCYKGRDYAVQCAREIIPAEFAEFNAQIEYNYSFTRFQTENARLLGMLDALGLNLNPAIIWNAIPWTFIVDWVIDVSRWLDQRKTLLLEPAINITRYSWSFKTHRRTRIRFKTHPSCTQPVRTPWLYLPDLWETSYRRTTEMPAYSSLLSVSGLSTKELSLGVALAITRRKRFKPRSR